MRTVLATEALLLASLFNYPELIPAYSDLTRDHFHNDFPYLVYERLVSSDIKRIINESAIAIVAVSLSKDKLISSEEFAFMVEGFNIIPNYSTAETAYNELKDQQTIVTVKNSLVRIVSELETLPEINESLAKINSTVHNSKMDEMVCVQSVVEHRESCKFNFDMGSLDNALDIEKTDLVVIAGRPFTGKTTFAVQLAMGLSRFGRVDFWSMEMSSGRIKEKVDNYGHAYKPENLFITCPVSTTIQRICRSAIINKPVAIFIDQFNKIKSSGKSEYEQFTSSARGLKELSVYLHIPIFCLAQINRDAQEGRPHLYQLKGSGSIEEESDVVMLLHVAEQGKTDIHLDKNRTKKGSVGHYQSTFNGEIYSKSEKIMY